jgi:hypothetical protein
MHTGRDSVSALSDLDGGRYSVGPMSRLQDVIEV